MKSFDTTAAITAILDIPAGNIRFVAGERADATVEVLPQDASKSRDVKAAEQTRVEFAGGVLRIETTVKNQILGSSGSVDVTVQLPAGSRVEATAASAEIRSTGPLGDLVFEGAHGGIEVDEVTSAKVTTSAGNVSIVRLGGPAEITTAQGDIRIAEAAGGEVVLRTQAGSISIAAAAGVSASLDAGTTSGRVTNSLKNDGDVQLAIHATTAVGDIVARGL
ncbi:hypothetical protein ACTI_19440 [Actinoplanes sp. OR16]|uniref:DUF4097 family beta strand repeat-containing protein n=1 Tax=Actinoplanes sp. OR16 TaxID=946334 RepID=UPI000F6C1712|nr:DUF4097 family beta strand repeat-containing protein [Actinoplanes sp. OR16]BBH65259.1 hypothetical protein ACTI_19440 [Actinoplanes sp. OR16]